MEKEKVVKLDLEFVLNGMIIRYEDGDKEVIQGDEDKKFFNHLGDILRNEMNIGSLPDNVSLEFKIKWNE